MSRPDHVWDVGLQPERTNLAWRRVGLAMLGLGLALPRVTFADLGLWCLPATVAALLCGAGCLAFVHRRYRMYYRSLDAGDAVRSGGRLPLLLSVVTMVVGLTAAAYVL